MKKLSKGDMLPDKSRNFTVFEVSKTSKKMTGFQYTIPWWKPDNFVDAKYFMIKIYKVIQKGKKLQQYTL